jgi:hypothetical protein
MRGSISSRVIRTGRNAKSGSAFWVTGTSGRAFFWVEGIDFDKKSASSSGLMRTSRQF